MPDYSVLAPVAPLRPEQLLPYAALVQWTSAARLWQGQTTAVDPHQMFAAVSAAGFRVPSATGVTLMPLRHPMEAALQARTLAAITGHPFVAGFGPAAAIFQDGLMPRAYRSPIKAAREYVTIVRGLLDGGSVDVDGEYFQCSGGLPSLPSPPVEVGLGVLRPGMARLAGEVADTVITWLTTSDYVRDTIVPAVREGAERAGRPMPRIVCMTPVALAGEDRDPVRLALASNLAHMSLPHYVDMLGRSGIHVDVRRPEEAAKALIKGRAFLYGTGDEVSRDLDAYHEAGADEVVLNVSGVCQLHGAATALRELEAILKGVER
ncbi:LLM class flavin-dependent oxidoreductase [Nocardiopsis sp. N85]|uniref:LLM class flavin-dependent oxidoreductase n=1 Tax=Nocardiopsis sp. N85 TaxID=3029400 RepID=UPI00237F640E|nr:LLM class flavin-dependent oxidoreductase [Nocardiopsis sp. N85]MDE3723105.1 LLM class flavin-dependent oxidoreductase [Nocardiopsis sp. N85]